MNDDFAKIVIGIAAILAVIFGAVLLSTMLKNNCVALLADKPAIEIQLVCK